MVDKHAVPGFLPSSNGLGFANRFPPGPTLRLGPIDPSRIGIGNAATGLCGGMSWYVRERFEAGAPIPPATSAPLNGTPLFNALVRRQVLSLDWLRVPASLLADEPAATGGRGGVDPWRWSGPGSGPTSTRADCRWSAWSARRA